MSIRPFYDRWPQYNRRLTEVIGAMSDEQLAIRPAPELWPIWAIWATVGHTAGARVYWLCAILGEPGAETTPFDPTKDEGWEDDLDHPRSAGDLVRAIDTTWAIIDRCLDRWTPAMLEDTIERSYGDQRQLHSRASIVQRLLTHEAYHGGELSQTSSGPAVTTTLPFACPSSTQRSASTTWLNG
ncbi:MAG: DinB family protein [Chloroflexota bacterium]